MKVVLRVDASTQIGTGHFMRCLTLAETLRWRGADIRFVSREHAGNLIHLLHERAMPVTVLRPGDRQTSLEHGEYASWLGVSALDDADQTAAVVRQEAPDWVVVDHYALDARWERLIRPHVGRLMAIDDLPARHHDCDVLLDQNARSGPRGVGLVPDSCTLLLGPRYALVAPEYQAYRQTLQRRGGEVRRVLVFVGGSDPHNLTGVSLRALSHAEFQHLEVDVVIGANNPHGESVRKQAALRPRTNVYGVRPHLADLMALADLAIGAAGTTTWERMVMGLPTIVVTIADNQRQTADALASLGLAYDAGRISEVTPEHLTHLLKQALEDPSALDAMRARGVFAVDGLGALRVAEVLSPSRGDDIRLQPARLGSASHCRPQTELHARSSLDVSVADLCVGKIRWERVSTDFQLAYSLDPIIDGRAWDARVVTLAASWLRQVESVEPGLESDGQRARYLRLPTGVLPEHKRFSIAILSDRTSWLNAFIEDLHLGWLQQGHRVLWLHDHAHLSPGDFCFYLGYGRKVPADTRARFRHNVVVHESDVPAGKGWSPLTWQIVEGASRIPVTLLEAEEEMDAGPVYLQEWIEFEGHEIIGELRLAQATATLALSRRFVEGFPEVLAGARKQTGTESVYRRRRAADSRMDPQQSIADQFDLLRVVDNDRYPAFFEIRGHRYTIRIDKALSD